MNEVELCKSCDGSGEAPDELLAELVREEMGTMREIKFRGKRIDNGEWVYGCLTRYSDHMSYIVVDVTENNGTYQVLTETVGQYTGLKDKNGKEIYEGDIIHDHKYDAGLGKVYWSQEYGGWSVHFFTQYTEQLHEWLVDYNEGAEIIGNIYENPELLKGDEDDA